MKRVILFIFMTLATTALLAQQVTLETCRRMARDRYPLSKQYGLIDQSEQYSLSNAARGWLPKLKFSAQASWQTDAAQFPDEMTALLSEIGNEFQGMRQDQYKVAIDVSQNIYDGGRSAAEKEAARAQAKTDRLAADVELYELESN